MLALIMQKVSILNIILNWRLIINLVAEVVDLTTLIEDTKYLVLLAKVHQKANRSEKALDALTRAREKQSRYIALPLD